MSNETLERVGAIIRLVSTLIAGICTMVGLYVDADELFTGICCICALVCLIYCWWKNNNLTYAAIEAQGVLDSMKSGDLTDIIEGESVHSSPESNQDEEIDKEDEEYEEDDPEGD